MSQTMLDVSIAKKKTVGINPDELRYLLTLRYYPGCETPLPKLGWEDFVPYPGIQNVVAPVIEGAIRSTIETRTPETVGIAISGGVDSTTVVALTRKLYPSLDIKTLCITFGDDTKEAQDAQKVAETFETDHYHLNIENPIRDLPEQIAMVGVPRWNTYAYYFFEYFKHVKPVDLLLTGDGGDELFGGYVFRYMKILAAETLDPRTYLESHEMDWVPDQARMFGDKVRFRWRDIYSSLSEYFSNPLSRLGQVFLADYNGKLLYDFAPTNMSFTKRFDLCTVAPMLSKEVIYTASHVPYHLKYDYKNNVGKIVLRQILLENFAYKAATKPKTGFGMDRREMWSKVKDSFLSTLEEPRCVQVGIINNRWLDSAVKKADSSGDLRYITKLFMILALEVWLRLFITREMKADHKL